MKKSSGQFQKDILIQSTQFLNLKIIQRYLYAKALRSVAIIIAKNDYDDNSVWAAKGCLRENGKLIILLNIEDIKKMYKMKEENDDPSVYLMNKLDTLLLELEK